MRRVLSALLLLVALVPATLHAAPVSTYASLDAQTDLARSYVGARYYASQTGRFTTVDPVVEIDKALVDPQRWNRYVYVRNNPLRYVDPDGRAIETVWDLISLGLSAKAVWQDPTSGWNWVSLGADVVSVLGPGIPAIGMAIRGGSKIDDAVDAARALEHATEAADAATAARVIGKYPKYLELAEQIGAKRFNVPEQIWDRMSDAERLAANNKFLDRGILGREAFRSTERISDVLKTQGFSWLRHEVDYLLKAGYRVAEDGYTLIPQ
jgi:RHS repeat-associated protein